MITISVLIPAYNEEKTILEVLKKVQAQSAEGVKTEIIVIDDGSQDQTVALLEQNAGLYDHLIKQPKNGGKGAAVLAGLRKASGDYVLFQDADLEYDPQDYGKLFFPARNYQADIVMGSRFLAPTCTRVAYFWHKIGNRFITLIFNLMNNTTFTDIYTCYLMFKRKLIQPDELTTFGWEQQAEILSLAVRRGRAFYEVPIDYFGRTYEEGKKIRGIHTIGVIWAILSTRFRSIKPFV